MKEKKVRLDAHCAEKGLSQSREKAKREIISGWVRVNGETVRDPSRRITGGESIVIERPGGIFVSRGGEKLNHALKFFNISLKGAVSADLGASTGGFTDCMLREGAARVYAVDVGYGQMDYSLQRDSRVIVMDRVNVRTLTADDIPERIDFVAADLSFISIVKVFDTIRNIFPDAAGVILIKPQFEAGPGEHKKGVVRKTSAHTAILARVIESLVQKGLVILGLTPSPVRGPAGNIEFLLHYSLSGKKDHACDSDALIKAVVEEAHAMFH